MSIPSEVKVISEFRNTYFFLSNFYPCSIFYVDMLYPTAEHAYQAQKYDPEHPWCVKDRAAMADILMAKAAKRKGKTIEMTPQYRQWWLQQRTIIMTDILRAKFGQVHMKKRLLDTGDAILMEGNTCGDTFWGVDVATGKGENHLGKCLMQVREELRKAEERKELK